jgi:hypothetical protein
VVPLFLSGAECQSKKTKKAPVLMDVVVDPDVEILRLE